MWSVERGDEIPEVSDAGVSRATGLARASTITRIGHIPFAGLDKLGSSPSVADVRLTLSKNLSHAEAGNIGDSAYEFAP